MVAGIQCPDGKPEELGKRYSRRKGEERGEGEKSKVRRKRTRNWLKKKRSGKCAVLLGEVMWCSMHQSAFSKVNERGIKVEIKLKKNIHREPENSGNKFEDKWCVKKRI